MNINEQLKADAERYGLNSSSNDDWFSFEEGENRVRILTLGEVLPEHFKHGYCIGKDEGCTFRGDVKDKHGNVVEKNVHTKPTVKWLLWVIDRKDGKIKLAKFSYKVMQQIGVFQEDPDYAWTQPPMPYDLKIIAKDAGKTNVTYTVVPAPKIEPLTDEEMKAFGKKHPVGDVVKAFKNKKLKEMGLLKDEPESDYHYPTAEEEEINIDDIPFGDN